MSILKIPIAHHSNAGGHLPLHDHVIFAWHVSAGAQADPEADNSDDEGDQVWQGVPPPDEAGPSWRMPAANGSSAAHAISMAAEASATSSAPSKLPATKPLRANGSSSRSRPVTPAANGAAAHEGATLPESKHGSQPLPAQSLQGALHLTTPQASSELMCLLYSLPCHDLHRGHVALSRHSPTL